MTFCGAATGSYIDVPKLIAAYRAQVNPKVMVYLVQVAGYADTLMPEFYDRTFIHGRLGRRTCCASPRRWQDMYQNTDAAPDTGRVTRCAHGNAVRPGAVQGTATSTTCRMTINPFPLVLSRTDRTDMRTRA